MTATAKYHIISTNVDPATHALVLNVASLTGKSVSTLLREALVLSLPAMKLDPAVVEDPVKQQARLEAAANALRASKHLSDKRREWKVAAAMVKKNKPVNPDSLAAVIKAYEDAIRADEEAKRVVSTYRR